MKLLHFSNKINKKIKKYIYFKNYSSLVSPPIKSALIYNIYVLFWVRTTQKRGGVARGRGFIKLLKMEVKIISEETIRPSSPTPSHLKNFKLSLLDQLYASSYVPILLFYSPRDGTRDTGQVLTRLKDSLSETLSCFYPLAGRIKDRVSIDCNDEGVTFLISQVMNCHLFEFLNNPQIDFLDRFAPCQCYSVAETSNVTGQIAVQVRVVLIYTKKK